MLLGEDKKADMIPNHFIISSALSKLNPLYHMLVLLYSVVFYVDLYIYILTQNS